MSENIGNIQEFYSGKSLLITGATGFLGKVLLEKLVRCCPKINKIFILTRPKKGKTCPERVTDLIKSRIFDKVRMDNPSALDKIIAINGDLTLEGLGISPEDQQTIQNTVSIVFHSAASVNFNEKLRTAINTNTLSVQRLIKMVRKFKKVDAIVFVSTSYSHSYLREIGEEFYELQVKPEGVLSMIDALPDEVLDKMTPYLIEGHPNTYTFSKALSENLILSEVGSLPATIVRPSIIGAAVNEPYQGWVDSYLGTTSYMAEMGHGFLRSLRAQKKCVLDVIPIDFVINLCIAAGWKTGKDRSNEIQIYNCVSGLRNPITCESFITNVMASSRKFPFQTSIMYPSVSIMNCKCLVKIQQFLFHRIPAQIVDLWAMINGQKPWMQDIQSRMEEKCTILEFWTVQDWKFTDNNTLNLYKQLSPQDKETFLFDVSALSWDSYIEKFILGIRQFLLRQDPSTISSSRRKMSWLYNLYIVQNIMFYGFLAFFIWTSLIYFDLFRFY